MDLWEGWGGLVVGGHLCSLLPSWVGGWGRQGPLGSSSWAVPQKEAVRWAVGKALCLEEVVFLTIPPQALWPTLLLSSPFDHAVLLQVHDDAGLLACGALSEAYFQAAG